VRDLKERASKGEYTDYLLRSLTPGSDVVGSCARAAAHKATSARAKIAFCDIMLNQWLNKYGFHCSSFALICLLLSPKKERPQILNLSMLLHEDF
jgi:hypothetical protein